MLSKNRQNLSRGPRAIDFSTVSSNENAFESLSAATGAGILEQLNDSAMNFAGEYVHGDFEGEGDEYI
jgi:hypothetical protein